MKFAERMGRINPPATLAINAKSIELKAQGVDIISLAVGEPDFPTPAHICEAAKKAIDEGFTRYTAAGGIPALRTAIADTFNAQHATNINSTNVIVTNGGKHSLYELTQALLEEGDEVLIPVPYWLSYPAMVALADAKSVFVPTTAEQNFHITIEALEAARTPNTRMLIMNAPSNPSGVCYSAKEYYAILDWAMEHDIFVISDEVYDKLVYEPAQTVSAAPYLAKFPDKIAIVNAFSKTYCMTGWRIGYTIASKEIISAMGKLQGQATSNVCSITQKAALAALTGPQDSIKVMRDAFQRRRDFALAEISTWAGVKCPKPDGAFYLFLDLNGVKGGSDDVAFCQMLLEKAHVATVPGTEFGMPGCMRISYAISDERLKEALRRIHDALYA